MFKLYESLKHMRSMRTNATDKSDRTSIGLRRDVLERVRAQKRGGETFDSLLVRMCEQYDPEPPVYNSPEAEPDA